jgi:dipeptidase
MCDTLVATPDYTASGTMILAKNSDREPNEAQVVVRYPRTRHKQKILKATFIEIPQVKETYEVILSKPFQMWGAEMGVNEHGVAIGNEAVFTRITPPKKNDGLTGMDMLRLALERSRSATAALECITELLAEFGQDACGGYENKNMFYFNSYIIADPKEAWVLETVDRHWVAEKVKGFRSISNGLTIETDFDLASEGLRDFAQQQGLTRGKDFNFRKVFSDRFYTYFSHCKVRQALSTELGRKGAIAYDVQTAMNILRSHHRGETDPARTGMQSLCMHAAGITTPSQTTGSMVAELRPAGKSTYWFTGTAAPCLSLFKPLFIPGKQFLAGTFAEPTARCDSSLWWRHEQLHRRALKNLTAAGECFLAERNAVEDELVRAERSLYKKSAAEREKFSRRAWQQADDLLVKWTERVKSAKLRGAFHPLYRSYWKKQNQRVGITA